MSLMAVMAAVDGWTDWLDWLIDGRWLNVTDWLGWPAWAGWPGLAVDRRWMTAIRARLATRNSNSSRLYSPLIFPFSSLLLSSDHLRLSLFPIVILLPLLLSIMPLSTPPLSLPLSSSFVSPFLLPR